MNGSFPLRDGLATRANWLGRVAVSRWWRVCAVCSAPRLSTPAAPEPLPHLSDSANQLLIPIRSDVAVFMLGGLMDSRFRGNDGWEPCCI